MLTGQLFGLLNPQTKGPISGLTQETLVYREEVSYPSHEDQLMLQQFGNPFRPLQDVFTADPPPPPPQPVTLLNWAK